MTTDGKEINVEMWIIILIIKRVTTKGKKKKYEVSVEISIVILCIEYVKSKRKKQNK